MKTISNEESLQMISEIDDHINVKNHLTLNKDTYTHICIKYPPCEVINYLTYQLSIIDTFVPWTLALLTDWSVFEQFENTHLYYLLRKDNNNNEHISDSPGHIFLNHERNELNSLLTIAILNAYDLLVINNYDYTRYKLSHDGFVDIYSCDEELIKTLLEFKDKWKL